MRENETLFNFVEVPEAFQDGYQESSDTLRNTYYNQKTTTSVIRSPSPNSSKDVLSPSSAKLELSPLSPPLELLGTFKRQKCLRFKNFRYSNSSTVVAQTSSSQPNSLQIHNDDEESTEDRRPILRSRSDIGDRYWNRTPELSVKSRRDRYQQAVNESFESNRSGSAGSSGAAAVGGGGKIDKSDSMHELENFFDQLGLDDKHYEENIVRSRRKKHQRSQSATVTVTYDDAEDTDHSSVVFFSDCSTVDSNRIVADSGVTAEQQLNPNLYRPSEPPSIVERNARIIKWLYNCKKALAT